MKLQRVGLGSRKKLPLEAGIQITSLADVFIIVLLFLIKNYSGSNNQNFLPKGIHLPISQLEQEEPIGLKVEISESMVMVDGKMVEVLKDYHFLSSKDDKDGLNAALLEAFDIYRKQQKLIALSNTSIQWNQKLVVIADKKTPYKTLKTVFASAATQDLTDIQLMVVRKEAS